jgi:hypothetical protein
MALMTLVYYEPKLYMYIHMHSTADVSRVRVGGECLMSKKIHFIAMRDCRAGWLEKHEQGVLRWCQTIAMQ